jgi:hypothetical protein
MAGKVLNLEGLGLEPDLMAKAIAVQYISWSIGRNQKIADMQEIRKYIYATDTTTTTNAKLPWKNKTTIPKLCQIRDNLYANYYATLFPKREWLVWEADDEASDSTQKRDAIENYMFHVVNQPEFKAEIQKLLLDYIDAGNVFVMPDWQDTTVLGKDGKEQRGFIGPVPMRISPLDIVFNPIAPSFKNSPKILRTIMSIGELKDICEHDAALGDNQVDSLKAFEYLRNFRWNASQAASGVGDLQEKDAYLRVDGFTSYRHYLDSDYVELMYFYGDIYDKENDKFYKNHIACIADRHKLISLRPNPSYWGQAPLFHVGWRPRQDNLWAMGPLDNLVGLQYRIDHLENLKADAFDILVFPPIKVKGFVQDFTWQPMEKIYIGDDGDVEMVAPDVGVLQTNVEIQNLTSIMEEMAGAPKEAMGFRNPGEKTMYEVQRLENAYSRIFQSKIAQFEEFILEPLLNAMLELARRKMTTSSIPMFNNELKFTKFMEITPADITGNGRIRPLAARHFAEKAEVVQNLTQFSNSPLGQNPAVMQHFSSIKIAEMIEDLLRLKDYKLVKPFIALSEQADSQRLMNSHEEQVTMEAGTPSGIAPDDVG